MFVRHTIALLLIITCKAYSGHICMSTASYIPTGNGPQSVCVANVTFDSLPDVIVCNYTDHTISVHRSNQQGFYSAPVNYPAGFGSFGWGPTCVIARDFDNDGDSDLAFTASIGSSVGLMRQIESGSFGVADFAGTGGAPSWLAAGDIDQDGDLDIVTADAGTASATALKNDGAAHFEFFSTCRVGIEPRCVVLADFDSDGDLDLATANRKSEDAIVQFNDGTGQFSGRLRLETGRDPRSLVAGDFDHDEDIDLAVANNVDGNVAVFLNDDSANFILSTKYSVNSRPTGLVAADLDNDGNLDLAGSGSTNRDYTILFGDGDGGFLETIDVPVGIVPYGITAADVNNDGLIDLLSPVSDENTIFVNINKGGGTFPPIFERQFDMQPTIAVAEDFDGDMDADVAVVENSADGDESALTIFKNKGSGELTSPQKITLTPTCYDAIASDIDNDSDMDLAVASYGGRSLDIFTNDGGVFQQRQTVPLIGAASRLAGADFDADGDADVVVRVLAPYPSQAGIAFLENDGSGTFAEHPIVVNIYGDQGVILARDFNGDGLADVMTIDFVSSKLFYYQNQGNWTFNAPVKFPVNDRHSWFVAGDLDNDNDNDVVVISATRPSEREIYWNQGSGSFVRSTPVPTETFANYAALSDFDENGWLDIALVGETPHYGVSILFNENGSLSPPTKFEFVQAADITPADLDGDGDNDYVIIDWENSRITTRINCGQPSFVFGDANSDDRVNVTDAVFLINFIFGGGPAPEPLRRGDINGDYLVNVSDVVRIVNYIFMGMPLR